MVLTFKYFRVAFSLILLNLLFLTGCNSVEQAPPTYTLRMDEIHKSKVKRPGTTGVRILPPKREPVVFEWKSGPAVYYEDLRRYGWDPVTIKLRVSAFGGFVEVLEVRAEDDGLARTIKEIVEKWSYTKSMFGVIKLTIEPLSQVTIADLSGLKSSNENRKPLIKRTDNVQ